MKVFWFQLGISITLAVCTICVLMLNSYLAQQKKTICYVGMTVMDVLYIGYIGLFFLRMIGIV